MSSILTLLLVDLHMFNNSAYLFHCNSHWVYPDPWCLQNFENDGLTLLIAPVRHLTGVGALV